MSAKDATLLKQIWEKLVIVKIDEATGKPNNKRKVFFHQLFYTNGLTVSFFLKSFAYFSCISSW